MHNINNDIKTFFTAFGLVNSEACRELLRIPTVRNILCKLPDLKFEIAAINASEVGNKTTASEATTTNTKEEIEKIMHKNDPDSISTTDHIR